MDVRYEYQTRQVNSSWYKNKEKYIMSKKKEKSKNYIAEKNLFFLWKLSKILVKKLYMSL